MTLRAALIDLDGVLYEGERAIPGAGDAVAWLRAAALPHLFVTNTTSRPRRAVIEKLDHLGIAVAAEQLLTPVGAAVTWIQRHASGPVALFVPPATAEEFGALPRLPAEAEAGAGSVVIGDLGEGWDFRTLNRAFRLLMATPEPAFIALGQTRYWRAADGLRLDVGAITAALERASGRAPTVLGKPSRAFFELALERLAVDPGETVMVGDDIVGDVGGAQSAGLRGVLVRTGKFRPQDLTGRIRPDAVLDSIAALPSWWREVASG